MITLWRAFWHALLWDEQAARRWLFGLGGVVASAGTTVMAFGVDTVLTWDKVTLLKHAVVAIVSAVLAMLSPTKKAEPSA